MEDEASLDRFFAHITSALDAHTAALVEAGSGGAMMVRLVDDGLRFQPITAEALYPPLPYQKD